MLKQYYELPQKTLAFLNKFNPSPRLIAHLVLVHHVSVILSKNLESKFSQFLFDKNLVLYGASLHDVGKIKIPDELTYPGKQHEQAGYELLLTHNIDKEIALIALNHSNWQEYQKNENIIVSIADNIWKGKRIAELENLLLEKIVYSTNYNTYEAFIILDDILEKISNQSDVRLQYQFSHQI